MGGMFEKGSSSSSSKRRRRNYDCAQSSRPRRKQHLYLALDDWSGGYSIHKLDADRILGDSGGRVRELSEPAAIRIESPVRGPLDFAALGTNIFVAPNPRFNYRNLTPPTIVYDTVTASFAVGPPLPPGRLALGAAMAAGNKLYALENEVLSLQALSWTPRDNELNLWGQEMEWSWNSMPSPPPCCGVRVVAYALHPDGRTIFMSTPSGTHSFDTSSGLWKELGHWVLPFRGQAYFDANLDAWVGIHPWKEGYICCCPVASCSTTAKRPPDCTMLNEKLFQHNNEETWVGGGRYLKTTLTYMGNSRFCLVENILCHEYSCKSVLHVTLFSLKYDHMGVLCTKVRPCTRSYAVSKNTNLFSHEAFWM